MGDIYDDEIIFNETPSDNRFNRFKKVREEKENLVERRCSICLERNKCESSVRDGVCPQYSPDFVHDYLESLFGIGDVEIWVWRRKIGWIEVVPYTLTMKQFDDSYVLLGRISFDGNENWKSRLYMALRGCAVDGEMNTMCSERDVPIRTHFFQKGDIIVRDGVRYGFISSTCGRTEWREIRITPMTDQEKKIETLAVNLMKEETLAGYDYDFRNMTDTEIIDHIEKERGRRAKEQTCNSLRTKMLERGTEKESKSKLFWIRMNTNLGRARAGGLYLAKLSVMGDGYYINGMQNRMGKPFFVRKEDANEVETPMAPSVSTDFTDPEKEGGDFNIDSFDDYDFLDGFDDSYDENYYFDDDDGPETDDEVGILCRDTVTKRRVVGWYSNLMNAYRDFVSEVYEPIRFEVGSAKNMYQVEWEYRGIPNNKIMSSEELMRMFRSRIIRNNIEMISIERVKEAIL